MEDKRNNPVWLEGDRYLGKAQPSVRRPFLDACDLGGALAMIRDADVWWAVKCCLLFMALTCVRSLEARGATWNEVDLDEAVWTIPASRTKTGVPHRVPLSVQAVEVLDYARNQGDGQGLLFPSRRGGTVMTSGVLSSIFRKLKIPAAPHGLRSSFSSWALGRADIPLSGAVLGYFQLANDLVGFAEKDRFEQRKPVMQKWADFLTETMGPVVPADADRR